MAAVGSGDVEVEVVEMGCGEGNKLGMNVIKSWLNSCESRDHSGTTLMFVSLELIPLDPPLPYRPCLIQAGRTITLIRASQNRRWWKCIV